MNNEQIIAQAMANHDKHYRCLVANLKRQKKNAFDLSRLIGEGATVAHAIWAKYDEPAPSPSPSEGGPS